MCLLIPYMIIYYYRVIFTLTVRKDVDVFRKTVYDSNKTSTEPRLKNGQEKDVYPNTV